MAAVRRCLSCGEGASDVIQQENLMDNVNQNSELLIQLLRDSLASDGVTVRGKGMMLVWYYRPTVTLT